VLGLATPAHAGERPPPWSGGASRITPFEARASAVAATLAGHDVSIECPDPAAWGALASQYGFPSGLTWALTPLRRDSSTGSSEATRESYFSPRACRLADAFQGAPTERGARICRHGTKPQWRKVRVSAQGKTFSRRVLVHVPVLGECDDWGQVLLAVHVLAHESMHLAGVIEEAPADCLGAQLGAFVATKLGASPRFARATALEYWRDYYRSQDPRYQSADCRKGGRLDLFPDRQGWPTPDRYPSDIASVIEKFASGEGLTTGSR
jgi:hypothetical protein